MIYVRARTASGADLHGLPLAAGLLLFVPITLLGNQIGSLLRYPEIGSAVFFPPYAALTAALLVSPRRDWIWYVAAGSAAHFATHWPHWTLSWVLLADAANVARALTAACLLRWCLGVPPRLDSMRALSFFVASAVLAAPAVGATLGAANVVLHGAADAYWGPWRAWLVSNALTGLVMLPALTAAFAALARPRTRPIARARVGEAVLLAIALVIASAVAFVIDGPQPRYLVLPLYAPLPVLIWAALRFGPGGASLALTLVAFAVIWSVDHGTGPFPVTGPDDQIIAPQIFVLLTAFPILCLAVINEARQGVVHLYRALLASMEDQVAILDARGVVLEVNDSWRRFAALADLSRFHGVCSGEDYLAACRAAAERGDRTAASVLDGVAGVLARLPLRFDIEYDHDHVGQPEAYTLRAEALARADGGAVITRANITARRRAQLEIDEQRRALSHLARVSVLGQLSGALAHELQQPLTSILGNAEAARYLLRRRPVDLDELSLILQDIVAEDRRAAEVIRRLRSLLQRGDLHRQPVDTGELLREVLALARAELVARRVTAKTVVAPDVPPLLGDRVQLQQVLLNLILNGCDAMGAIAAPDRQLLLSAAADDGGVHVAVRDCGTGIPAALVDRLFEPFVTTKPDGLGLGLSISRTIVTAHGGRLWAENNPDGGATMHCVLTAAASGDACPMPAASAASVTAQRR